MLLSWACTGGVCSFAASQALCVLLVFGALHKQENSTAARLWRTIVMAALMALFLVLDVALELDPGNHTLFIADCIA